VIPRRARTAVLGLLLAATAAPGVARTPVSFSGSFPITRVDVEDSARE
jgi:hypothetical protein